MKKLLLTLLTALVSMPIFAKEKIGDLYYELDESTLTAGVTYQYPYSSGNYQGLESAIIPETVTYDSKNYTVTSIGYSAFYWCSSLTSVEIPNSVTEIGNSAFCGCSGLTSVTIPNSVTSIGGNAFSGCSGLTSVTIPNSVTEIGWYSYQNCSGLTSLTIGNSVSSIGDFSFDGCSSLSSLTFEDGESTVTLGYNSYSSNGEGLFADCPLKNIYIGRSLSYLSERAYGYSPFANITTLTEVTIADNVTSLPGYLLYDCTGLTNLTIGNSVTSIGNSAFEGCRSLTSVQIPNSVTSIGSAAFYNCSGLTKVEISDLAAWCNIEFVNDYSNPLYYANHLYLNGEELIDLIIPNSVTSIGNYAFYNCNSLTSVEIPNSVTEIGNYAFRGCSCLTSVTIPNSVTSIGEYAFYICSGLTSLEIPNSVTSIDWYAFSGCSGLTSLEIPSSVTEIGGAAFEDIEFDSFKFSDGPALLRFNGINNINTKSLYLGRSFSRNLSSIDLESMKVGGFVTSIPGNRFNNSTLRSVTINPGAQIVIEDGAFSGCRNLAELILPEDIAEIGANAFSGTPLKNITVPGGVIGANAFANCNLDNIILGANVVSIGENAFDGSNAIKNVYATPTTPPAAQDNTFSYYEAQLWVPEEAIDTYYYSTRCWDRFSGKPLVCPENIVVTGPEKINGKPGETVQLSATIAPDTVTLDRVLWRSTNPAVATVDNYGLVTLHNFQVSEESEARIAEEGFCQIIASTLYEESPVAVVNIEVSSGWTTSIEYVNSEDMGSAPSGVFNQNDVYTLQGVCVKRQASQGDIEALTPGIYIIGGKKVIVK